MPAFPVPDQPKHEAVRNSYLILKYAHDTAESLHEAFLNVRRARGAKGAPKDEEQDLLRAMVVFAGAGIDAMTKQLIRDTLPVMVDILPQARSRIQRLGTRHLGQAGTEDGVDDASSSVKTVSPERLARVLFAENPRMGMVEILIDDLTAGSLQSTDELYRILGYLGLEPGSISVIKSDLQAVFRCRNLLIHEMDIDFTQPNRNRFPRRLKDMVQYAQTLLGASNSILKGVDEQLSDTGSG